VKRLVRSLAVLYLAALLALWTFIHFDTGNLWLVTLFLFSPRWAVAAPLIILLPLTLVMQRRLTPFYLLHGLIIVFPIMDCRVAWSGGSADSAQPALRVMTCNLGGGDVNVSRLTSAVRAHQIHVLALQECSGSVAKSIFEELGWSHNHLPKIAIGSCFELSSMELLARHPPSEYLSAAAVSCDVLLPLGSDPVEDSEGPQTDTTAVRVVAVHFPTFRPALERARSLDVAAGAAMEQLGTEYSDVVRTVPPLLTDSDLPMIILGDFNVPVESTFYRRYWSNYRNTLSTCGSGFRYTKHTQLHGIRIDHVLTDERWSAMNAIVGPAIGSDHRPVIAELSLHP